MDKRNVRLVFICDDDLLRKTVQGKLKNDSRFSSYETLEDFASYLRLTKEKLSEQFIKALVKRATKKFFSKNKQDCLYYRENIKEQLRDRYRGYFDKPEKSEKSFPISKILGMSDASNEWEALDQGMFWISNAQYLKIEEGYYYWNNTITFVRQYRKKQPLLL